MSAWHRENPDLIGTPADPWWQHADYRLALHHHRDLRGASCSTRETPAEARSTPSRLASAGIPSRRCSAGTSCDNCGAPEGVACAAWCLAEQYS